MNKDKKKHDKLVENLLEQTTFFNWKDIDIIFKIKEDECNLISNSIKDLPENAQVITWLMESFR